MGSNFNTLNSNIKYLMHERGISSVTELSKLLKMQQSTLQRMLTGEVKDPKYTTLKNIAEYFEVSPVDLIECNLREQNSKTVISAEGNSCLVNFKKVPVLGKAQPGDNRSWTDTERPAGSGEGFIRWPSSDKDAFALKCVGDEMTPRIKEGEYVIIEPNHKFGPGDEILVITDEGEVMIKIFLFERDSFYHLLPVNEDHAPVRLAKSKAAKMQFVAGIAKSSLWHP